MIYNGKHYRPKAVVYVTLFSLLIIGAGIVDGSTSFAGVFIGGFIGIGSGLLLIALSE